MYAYADVCYNFAVTTGVWLLLGTDAVECLDDDAEVELWFW